jgi:hypothetical protein
MTQRVLGILLWLSACGAICTCSLEGPADQKPDPTGQFTCQGKRECPEMKSCEEAKFYLKNCPDVNIDGDGDGVPCEDQFCGH